MLRSFFQLVFRTSQRKHARLTVIMASASVRIKTTLRRVSAMTAGKVTVVVIMYAISTVTMGNASQRMVDSNANAKKDSRASFATNPSVRRATHHHVQMNALARLMQLMALFAQTPTIATSLATDASMTSRS